MSSLPHEVLLTIFEHLDDKTSRPSRYSGKVSPLLPLLTTCRPWRVLAETILYRRIALDLRMDSTTHRRRNQLIYNLQQQIARIRYVKELTLELPLEYGDKWQKSLSSVFEGLDLVRIIGWFTGHIEKLFLKGAYLDKLG